MFKKLFILPVAFAAAISFTSPALACGDEDCSVCEAPKVESAKPVKGELVSTTYSVTGLNCEKCATGLTNKLSAQNGVSKVNVDMAKHTVVVTHAKGQATMANLQAALGSHFKLAEYKAPATKAVAGEDCCAPEAGAKEHGTKAAPKK